MSRRAIDPVITHGTVHGRCPKCGEPYMGTFDADDQDVHLECVSCHHEGLYKYVWPDELPKVILRHRSSGQLLASCGRAIKKKKIKTKNPDGALPGQMKFEGV